MNNLIVELQEALHQGFINKDSNKKTNFKPALLVNNPQKNEYVLTSLIEELETCHTFSFAIAFITEDGLAMIKSKLLDLKEKGIQGRIITSDYLTFNKPKVFKELMKLENVAVRITNVKGFHTKGYIFDHGEYYTLVVGSSNLTQTALKENTEWNIKLTSHENGEIVNNFKSQFDDLWYNSTPLNKDWISTYEEFHQKHGQNFISTPQNHFTNINNASKIMPNQMQEAALTGISAVREAGKKRGIIISATGTGKTFLSAFDVQAFQPRKMLFVVHREQILQKAMSDFKKILGGNEEDYRILSSSQKLVATKYLFATIQTLQKDQNLKQFKPDHFDYILVDEAHRAGSGTYTKILNYFQPKFLLGMTATPERSDGFNIYELFDYNIAYEIRLQEALEAEMLCPFHYFGVTDFLIDGKPIEDNSQFSTLVNQERVKHIVNKINYYGYSGEKVCGLIFCSRKEEAKQLSALLNTAGFKTCALTGDDSQEIRENAVIALENGELDYILTVDIFNEGVDIPSVNQVIMLRQTQSSIIFIQQLGRGLRKHESKDYTTIIDFIGNYKNNYLIPIALSGDFSQNKDNIRRRVKDTSYLKGISTINFEEIAKQQIYKSINNTNLTATKILKEAYEKLKFRLGRKPLLQEFYSNKSTDPVAIMNSFANYYQFLTKIGEEDREISDSSEKILTFISQELLNGKRLHEILLLEAVIKQKEITVNELNDLLLEYNCPFNERILTSLKHIFNLEFFVQRERKKYGKNPLINFENNTFLISGYFSELLQNKTFNSYLVDIIKTAKLRSVKYSPDRSFTIGEKYARKDVCRLLNWDFNEYSTIYGYKIKHGACVIFVTLNKKADVKASVNYANEFLSNQTFRWFSKNNRTLQSKEVKKIINAQDDGTEIHFFIKKDDAEGTDFYYLGELILIEGSAQDSMMKGEDGKLIPGVAMEFYLEQPVEQRLYQYLIEN